MHVHELSATKPLSFKSDMH